MGTTPGAAPSGNPAAIVRARPVVEIDRDQRLGSGVDDVQPIPVDQNALRAAEFVRHGLAAGPGERDHPAGAGLRYQPPAVGRDRHPDRIGQPGRDHLDPPAADRHHPSGSEFGGRDRPVGGDRHPVELIETVGQHVAFAVCRPVARDLATGGGDDELARSGGSKPAKEPRIARREQHAHGLQSAVGPQHVEVGAVGDVQPAVGADGQIQRPVQPAGQHGLGSRRRRGSR